MWYLFNRNWVDTRWQHHTTNLQQTIHTIHRIQFWKCKLICCRRLADSDITVTPSVSAWTDYSSDIIMQLIQFPLQQHWLFLRTWGRNVNLHHLVQSKWETDDSRYWRKIRHHKPTQKREQSVTYIGYPESKFRWAIKKKTRIYYKPCILPFDVHTLHCLSTKFPPVLRHLS